MPQQPDPSREIGTCLARAEDSMLAVSHALVQGEPDLLEAASRALHQSAQSLSDACLAAPGMTDGIAYGMVDKGLKQRLVAVVQGMALQREACVRRLAVVERALHGVIPATRPSTYGTATGPYTRDGQQSGMLRGFS